MYHPTAADYEATVTLSRARGIDPRDVALVEFWESGFDPQEVNSLGYSGINQMSPANLKTYGLTPQQWVSMSIAQQQAVAFQFWDSMAEDFAGGHFPVDGANLFALNVLPGRYLQVGALTNRDAALSTKGDPWYAKNQNLDPRGTGSITVNTIADRLALVEQKYATDLAPIFAGIDAAEGGPQQSSQAPAPSQIPAAVMAAGTVAAGVAIWQGITWFAERARYARPRRARAV